MLDPRHIELLHDCDLYLERQQNLLHRLAAEGAAAGVVAAMDAALDQLSHAVMLRRREVAPESAGGDRPVHSPRPHSEEIED